MVGSYSRGEAIEGISDIEFWAVVEDLAKAKNPGLGGNMSLGFTTKAHLKRLKPYIYTVEVKKFGKVIIGDPDVLDRIPDYSYEDIDPLDGFILLNNRIVEQLILLNKIEAGGTLSRYEIDKGYIQLVNALLPLKRKYRGLYNEKIEAFNNAYKNDMPGLAEKAEEAVASIKSLSADVLDTEDALNKWHELRGYFKKAWLKEMALLGDVRAWLKILVSGKISRVYIYKKAYGIYFSDKYRNKELRDIVIDKWNKDVK